MAGINDYRETFPQYDQLTDDELTEALYRKAQAEEPESLNGMTFDDFSQGFRGAPIEPERAHATMADKIDGKLTAQSDPLNPSLAEEEPGLVSNTARLFGERLSEVGGSSLAGISTLTRPAADALSEWSNIGMGVYHDENSPRAGEGFEYLSHEEIKADPELEAWVEENRWANSIPRWFRTLDLGGEERFSTEAIKEDYAAGNYAELTAETAGWIFETGGKSLGDMLGVMASLPAYVIARSQEIGEINAELGGASKEDVTNIDVIEAMPFAIASAVLERIGAKGVLRQDSVEQIGKETLEAGWKKVVEAGAEGAGKEAVTEFLQEGIVEYVGERFGTDAELKVADGFERGMWGALAGAGMGGPTAAAVETIAQVGDATLERIRPDDVMETFLNDEVREQPEGAPEPEVPVMVAEDILGDDRLVPTIGEPIDPRLKREGFRQELTDMAGDLVHGGDIGLIPDPDFVPGESTGDLQPGDPQYPMIRTPSINPSWFQDLAAEEGITVAQTINAVRKSLEGIRLGPREERVVRGMLDQITGTREQPAELEAARAELEARRFDRREGIQPVAPIEVYETLAETFAEQEYLPDMDFEARAIFDLADELEARGGDPDPIIDAPTDNVTTINELETAIEEASSDETMQAGITPAPEQQVQPTEAEAARQRANQPGAGQIDAATVRTVGTVPEPDQQLHTLDSIRQRIKRKKGQRKTNATMVFEVDGFEIEVPVTDGDVDTAQRTAALHYQEQVVAQDPRFADLVSRGRRLGYEGADRRENQERRERIAAMTPDEVYQELYTDQLTGLGNLRGFTEGLGAATAVASIDADFLKAVNDNMGHSAGDAMLSGIGRAIQDVAGFDGYRTGGDEFYILGDSESELESMLEQIQETLNQGKVRNDRGTLEGLVVTAGVGTDKDSADLAMETAKKQRPARGEVPGNLTLNDPKPTTGDLGMSAGSAESDRAAVESGTVAAADLAWNPGANYSANIDKLGDLPLTPENEYRLGDGRLVRIPKATVRREHIIGMMEKMFGIGIYQGRVKGKTMLGYYRLGQGAIRIKHQNDIETTAHEFGHWIDDRNTWVEQLYKRKEFDEEMRGVSYDVKKVHEGYAEFMRLWLTQDVEARKVAPKFYDAWMKELRRQDPDLMADIGRIQEMMHAWHLQGVKKRRASKIGSSKLPITERIREGMRGATDELLRQSIDRTRAIRQAERTMEGELGEGINSAWKSFTLAKGSRAVMEAVYMKGTIKLGADHSMQFSGKGLREIFAPVEKKMELMQHYMVGRRALELKQQGRENLFRVDEIKDALDLANQHPEFKTVFDEFQAFNNRMLDFYEEMGILGPDTRKAIAEMNENYVPFNRIIESAKDGKLKTQSGGSPFQRLRGGTGNINDVFDSVVSNHSHLIALALNNRAKRTFYDMIDRNKNQEAGQFATKVTKDIKSRNIPSAEIKRAIANGMGLTVPQFNMSKEGFAANVDEAIAVSMIDNAIKNLDELVKLFEPGISPEGPDIDVVLRDGKKEFYQVHDTALIDALANFGAEPTNLALNMLGGFANLLRTGVTSFPGFQVRNFMRDSGSSWTLSRGQTLPLVGPVRELFGRFINDEKYWEFVINGGGILGRTQADKWTADKVVYDPGSLRDKYEDLLGYAEYANRIAEFRSLTDKGVHPSEAAFAGRQISTDFAMRGRSDVLRYFTVGIPFLNARMQSLYRLGREVAESPPNERSKILGKAALRLTIKGLTAMTIPALVLYFFNKDDERYQEMPDYVRDLYFVFFTGDGEDEYFLIPKPFEVGTIFATMPERIYEYIEKRDGKELADAMGFVLTSTFKVDPELQIIKPLLEVGDNEKWTGAPIVPAQLEDVAPQEQYRTYTHDSMIALGRKLGISPLKAEHVVKGYLGQFGVGAMTAADALIGDLSQGGIEPASGWEDSWWNPISSLINDGPPRRTNSEQDFYEFLKITREVGNTQALITGRSPERLAEYLLSDDVTKEFSYNESFSAVQKQISGLNNARDQVASSNIDAEAKREALDELQRAKNKIFRDFMQATLPDIRGLDDAR